MQQSRKAYPWCGRWRRQGRIRRNFHHYRTHDSRRTNQSDLFYMPVMIAATHNSGTPHGILNESNVHSRCFGCPIKRAGIKAVADGFYKEGVAASLPQSHDCAYRLTERTCINNLANGEAGQQLLRHRAAIGCGLLLTVWTEGIER